MLKSFPVIQQHHVNIVLFFLGIQECLRKFKNSQQKEYLNTVNLLPFLDRYNRTKSYGKENEFFVELSILSQESVDRNWENHEKGFHLEQVFAPKQNINIKDILKEDVPLTVVSGIAGIGKSTLVKQIVGGCTRGKIWKEFGRFSSSLIVIPVRCRDLNTLRIDETTDMFEVICKLHPDLSSLKKTDFQEIRQRTVLLLDGIDELIDVESVISRNNDIKPTAKLLRDTLANNNACCQWRVVFGRPKTSWMIQNLISEDLQQDFFSVEVCGFDSKNVKLYIKKAFVKDTSKIKKLLMKIEISQTLRAMSTVPAYLSSIPHIDDR